MDRQTRNTRANIVEFVGRQRRLSFWRPTITADIEARQTSAKNIEKKRKYLSLRHILLSRPTKKLRKNSEFLQRNDSCYYHWHAYSYKNWRKRNRLWWIRDWRDDVQRWDFLQLSSRNWQWRQQWVLCNVQNRHKSQVCRLGSCDTRPNTDGRKKWLPTLLARDYRRISSHGIVRVCADLRAVITLVGSLQNDSTP